MLDFLGCGGSEGELLPWDLLNYVRGTGEEAATGRALENSKPSFSAVVKHFSVQACFPFEWLA